jgi:hypothetical protein
MVHISVCKVNVVLRDSRGLPRSIWTLGSFTMWEGPVEDDVRVWVDVGIDGGVAKLEAVTGLNGADSRLFLTFIPRWNPKVFLNYKLAPVR